MDSQCNKISKSMAKLFHNSDLTQQRVTFTQKCCAFEHHGATMLPNGWGPGCSFWYWPASHIICLIPVCYQCSELCSFCMNRTMNQLGSEGLSKWSQGFCLRHEKGAGLPTPPPARPLPICFPTYTGKSDLGVGTGSWFSKPFNFQE